jgi:hypothetical protein
MADDDRSGGDAIAGRISLTVIARVAGRINGCDGGKNRGTNP